MEPTQKLLQVQVLEQLPLLARSMNPLPLQVLALCEAHKTGSWQLIPENELEHKH